MLYVEIKIFGQIGLIEQVNEHSGYIEEDKKFKNKIIGGLTAITTAWGLIITAVVKFERLSIINN